MIRTAIAILAHPDDAEFLCAGTLLRLREEAGFEIHIATLTAGDCGSTEHSPTETGRIRRAEGASAAELLGAAYHCIGERDMRVHCDDGAVEKVVNLLQAVRPGVVFTHSPDDYHPDHEATSRIVRSAAFAAPIRNYLYDSARNPPLEHLPHLYYCDPIEGKDIFGRPIIPQFRIDVSRCIDRKAEALAAHASQRDWLLKHQGVDDYLNAMRAWGAEAGAAAGVAYAEGFRQHLGHGYPKDNAVGEALGIAGI